jgi:hypothetical protein
MIFKSSESETAASQGPFSTITNKDVSSAQRGILLLIFATMSFIQTRNRNGAILNAMEQLQTHFKE